MRAVGGHQAFHGAAGHGDPFPVQLQPHLPGGVHPTNVAHQHLVAPLPPGRGLVHVLVVRRWGDLQAVLGQHGTDRLDTPTQATGFAAVGVVADELHDQREGRP